MAKKGPNERQQLLASITSISQNAERFQAAGKTGAAARAWELVADSREKLRLLDARSV